MWLFAERTYSHSMSMENYVNGSLFKDLLINGLNNLELHKKEVNVLYVVVEIEKTFDITMQGSETSQFETVGDVVEFLAENI